MSIFAIEMDLDKEYKDFITNIKRKIINNIDDSGHSISIGNVPDDYDSIKYIVIDKNKIYTFNLLDSAKDFIINNQTMNNAPLFMSCLYIKGDNRYLGSLKVYYELKK